MRNVTGDPWAGVARGRAVRPDPLRRRLRALLRAPPDHAGDAAQGQDLLRRQPARPRDQRHPRHRLPRARQRDRGPRRGARRRDAGRRRHLDHAAQGAGAVRLPRARQRRVPEGHRGRHADLRPPGVAARQPRPRPHQGVRRQVRHRRAAQPGRGGAARATGSPNATSRSSTACSSTTSASRAPAPPQSYGSPNGDLSEFERFRAANVRRAEAGGLRDGRGEGHARRPHARAVPRPRRRSCATTPAATRARRCSRTSCCAGCARSASTTSGGRCRSSGLGDAGSREINDVVSCPGTDSCKLGITSSMGLNEAVQERIEAMQHHRRADAQAEHQDQRLPERLRPAPRRRASASRARRSKSASTRSPPTSRTSAACSKAARSSSARA